MNEKLIGYILLFSGLIVIGFTTISVYSVFTKQVDPVKLFNFPAIKIPAQEVSPGVNTAEMEILPGSILTETSNIIAHLFLMGFVSSVGLKLSILGTSMVRPIVIKMNQNPMTSQIKT